MDETTNSQGGSDGGAWVLSRLGFAIDTYVDRQINGPQVIAQTGAPYGIDQNGNLYKVGQPTVVQTVSPMSGAGGSGMLLLVLAIAFVASHHGK
jgi:hypothetical protein